MGFFPMTSMTQEFPKCLYAGGDVSADCFVVFDCKEENDKRREGFSGPGESLEKSEEPKKRGRPKKVINGTE